MSSWSARLDVLVAAAEARNAQAANLEEVAAALAPQQHAGVDLQPAAPEEEDDYAGDREDDCCCPCRCRCYYCYFYSYCNCDYDSCYSYDYYDCCCYYC